MNEEELKNEQGAEYRGDHAINDQQGHRVRHRIHKVEKVEFTRNYSEHREDRGNDRENTFNNRPSFNRRPYSENRFNGQDRPKYQDSYRRRSMDYNDNDNMQYTNNLNTYHDAGVGYPQSDRMHDQSRGYRNPRGNNRQEGHGYTHNVAYAKGSYNRELPASPNSKPKFKKQNKGKQIPPHVVRYKDITIDPTQPMRLNRFLSNAGVCSRRDADSFIKIGFVKVNGEVVTELGTKVMLTDEVKFKNRIVKLEDKIYVLLNKPKGYVTTCDDPENRKTVMDLVRGACTERIYSVGRLDRNTTGVLLLTNDGELSARLTHPKFLKKKIYHVFLNKEILEEDMEKIRSGITLEDGEIKADAVEYAKDDDKKQVGIEIHSGRNRIVRRIFETLGYHVIKLDRVYFAGLTKKNLKRGSWRYLTEEEVSMLKMGAFE